MLAPPRSSMRATSTNSSSLAPTTLAITFLPRGVSSRAIPKKCSTPRFFRFSGASRPARLHDLNTIAPPCAALSSRISPRSAERGPDAFITDDASSTPPSRIEVRSIPTSYCARLPVRKQPNTATALSAESMTDSSILIAGAGAIGSIVGGMLHDAGHDVTLLGRRAHLEAIARDGLKISGLLGDRTVTGLKLADDPAKLGGRFGLILCTVKSYDTDSIAAVLADRLADDGVIVSMQNGLGNIESLIGTFGERRVLGARVIFGAEMRSPGSAHVTVFAQPVAIGPAPALQREDASALASGARAIAAMLDAAGVPAVGVDDIMPVLWTKILYNVALNPLGALLRLHYGALAEDPDARQIMDRAIDEAFTVAHALGVALPFSNAAEYRKVFYEQLIPPTFSHRPTMLHDLHVRGRTDIGALNGRIVELADRFGIGADTNRMLTQLIRAAERATGKKENR